MSAEIAIGRYVLQTGEAGGAVLREARRAERAHFHPRPAPVMLRPRLLRALVDRRTETEAALAALDAGLPVEVSGAPGVGKTAFLRHLAHHPRSDAFTGGVVYLSAAQCTPLDLLQRIFDAFYETESNGKPTQAEIQRALQDTHALILLDDLRLSQKDVEQVLDIAPRSAFVVASRTRCLWGEIRSIALAALAAEDGALLFERELERTLDPAERPAAAALCTAIEGHPRRILQVAADVRRHGVAADGWSRYTTPDGPLAEIMTSIDEKDRRALLALSALAGLNLEARHIAGLAELPDIDTVLTGLVDRGLILSGDSRYRLADGVADRLRRSADPTPWLHRAVTYFLACAERLRRDRGSLFETADALLRAQQHATDTRRWGEALRLGRLLEDALAVSARWGAWEVALEGCLSAAKAIGDRSVEAWVLHQMGTRALALGDESSARHLLTQAVRLRDELGERAAASISRRNLGFLAAAAVIEPVLPIEVPGEAATIPSVPSPAFDSIPFRGEAETVPRTRTANGAGAIAAVFVACAIVGGVAYSGIFRERFPSWWAVSQAPSAAVARPQLRETTEVVRRPADAAPALPAASAAARANILIFTARPGSIATSRRTNLCYAVSDAASVRIEPGVGNVDPAASLTCRGIAPLRTTTYELIATGHDGVPVSQHVVIVVR